MPRGASAGLAQASPPRVLGSSSAGLLLATRRAVTPNQLVFELFEHVLSGARPAEGAGTIAFDLLSEPPEAWSFDPSRPRRFAPGDLPEAPLRVRAKPELLVRLFFDPEFPIDDAAAIELCGDPEALGPLIDALADGHRSVALRAGLEADHRRRS